MRNQSKEIEVKIVHTKQSGEFRYEVQECESSQVVDYFYSQKDAVKYCESNHLKMV